MKNDELHIITSILAGNTERFSYFLDTYGQQIFTLIVRMVGSPEDAEELTHHFIGMVVEGIPPPVGLQRQKFVFYLALPDCLQHSPVFITETAERSLVR